MDTIVIATRGSQLALWQANAVADAIREVGYNAEIRIMTTKGDKNLTTPLSQLGDKGIFVEELEAALLCGEVDVCVHSTKDMPAVLTEGCTLAAMLPRADAHDVLLLPQGAPSVSEFLAGNRVVGTGSLRRAAQLKSLFPGLDPVSIRGNLGTRIGKMDDGNYDGIVLAAAGVKRLGLSERISHVFEYDELVPAAGQGAICIETRLGDERIQKVCDLIGDAETLRCVTAERLIMRELGGSCKVPIGAFARVEGDATVMDAFAALPDGSRFARAHVVAPANASPELLAEQALQQPASQDAQKILEEAERMTEQGEARG